MGTDLTGVVTQLITQNQILTETLAQFQKGISVLPIPAVYTVAGLPATAATGQWAWASNGRLPGQGGGAGTGCPVFFNSATSSWYSYCSGAAVTS